MSPKKGRQKSGKSTTAINKKFKGFTDEERVAMKERIQELKAATRRGPRADKADGAMAAGLADRVWTVDDLLKLLHGN